MGGREAAAGPQAEAHRRIEVRAGDVAEGVGAGEHGEAEGQRHADEADAHRIAGAAEAGRQYGTAASSQNKPERADEFGRELLDHVDFPRCVDGWNVRNARTRRALLR